MDVVFYFKTILKICYKSSLEYFGIKKVVEIGSGLVGPIEKSKIVLADGAEAFFGVKSFINLLSLLET